MGQKESLILNRFPKNSENAQITATEKLISLVNDSLNKNVPVLLLLSGGTWIPPLNQVDCAQLKISNLEKLTITSLDERAELGSENNFSKIVNTSLISFFLDSGAQTISTLPRQDESAHSLGEKINRQLKEYLQKNPNAILIATAGVGGQNNVPGHIAGIEPMKEDPQTFSEVFQNPDILYFGYIAKHLKPELRATATFTLLDKVDHFILLILNPEEKRLSLGKILSNDPAALNEAPCVYFHNRPNTAIYTDISL